MRLKKGESPWTVIVFHDNGTVKHIGVAGSEAEARRVCKSVAKAGSFCSVYKEIAWFHPVQIRGAKRWTAEDVANIPKARERAYKETAFLDDEDWSDVK